MRALRALEIAFLTVVALGGTACSLEVEQILEVQEGSGVDLFLVPTTPGTPEVFQDHLEFHGGAVMAIDVSLSLFNFLDGSMDGDVEVLDVLFAVPSFRFLIAPTGLVCAVLDEESENGGTFGYDFFRHEASFDVFVDTRAIPVEGNLAQLLRGGAFEFPFDLEASLPLTLIEALGLLSGSGSLAVTQEIDSFLEVRIVGGPDPASDGILQTHAVGSVSLQSTDAFPATPLVLDCLDALAGA